MRLLNVHSLNFRMFYDDVPKYAIASHRWCADDEASLKDVIKHRNTTTSGYKKVEGFAEYIKCNLVHVDWLWIDTCCIDKKSDRETTEAINSMFRWYRQAEVCLAYLPDVSTASDENVFRQSEWFRRGWTLQELLAPRTVVFLTRDWELIGHRAGDGWSSSGFKVSNDVSLSSAIATITGVPECVLQNFNRSKSFSVEERLTWIAGRETTCKEDMSYSLLGLFDISMPVIYGEGAEKARQRLIEEINKTNNPAVSLPIYPRSSEVSSTTLRRPSHNIPYPQDRDFIDRGAMVQDILKQLNGPARKAALVGLGGVGKSQLAIESAYRIREQSPDSWVLWLYVGNTTRFEQGVRDVADLWDIPNRTDKDVDIFHLLRNWLLDESHGRWTVILDNLDDVELLADADTNVKGLKYSTLIDCFPFCSHGSILVTSRSSDTVRKLIEDDDIIFVDPMIESEAIALLKRKVGEQISNDTDIADLTELVQTLEFMPLAITQAAAYIKQRGQRCPVSQYQKKLQANTKSERNLLSQDSGDLRRDRESKNSIISTWQISFEHVRRLRRSAADLLALMSYCNRDSIPEHLLRAKPCDKHKYVPANSIAVEKRPPEHDSSDSDDEDDTDLDSDSDSDESFESDIALLQHYSFISLTASSSKAFTMHRLVQLATQTWLRAHRDGERSRFWGDRLIANLCAITPRDTFAGRPQLRTLHPHLISAFEFEPKSRGTWPCWMSILEIGVVYCLDRVSKGFVGEAERMVLRVIRARKRTLGGEGEGGDEGEDEEMGLVTMDYLTAIYCAGSRWGEAQEVAERGLGIRRRLFGEDGSKLRQGIADLACVSVFRGRWEEAEKLLLEAREICRTTLVEESEEMVSCLCTLVYVYVRQERWKEAEELGLETLAICRRSMGEENVYALGTWCNLACSYNGQGRLKEAEELGLRTLATSRKIFGEDEYYTLVSLENLASTYSLQGRQKEAEEIGERALDGRQKLLGVEHPETLRAAQELMAIHRRHGNQVRVAKLESIYTGVSNSVDSIATLE